ncbi:hypothetical protein VTK56DRAFT_2595 [Thermocarpiscus australiensis]
MAAVSQTTTTLTSPVSPWEDSLPVEIEGTRGAHHDGDVQLNGESAYPADQPPLLYQNGISTIHKTATSLDRSPGGYGNLGSGSDVKAKGVDAIHLPQHHNHRDSKPRSIKDHAGSIGSPLDPHLGAKRDRAEDGSNKGPGDLHPDSDSDENSKWIHRDKLAKIESEELQAAGIFLPHRKDRTRSKSQNRPRRDQSQDKVNSSSRSIGGAESIPSRSRKNSAATSTELRAPELASIPSWDLRRPEEILEESDGHWVSSSSGKGLSRIPVAKVSPVPISSEHIVRDTPLVRKRDGSPGEEDTITYLKPRARSVSAGNAHAKATNTGGVSPPAKRTDSSPKKAATASATRKTKPANGAAGRSKTRGAPSKDSTSSATGTTRPSTRSAEREFSSSSKQMEGDPPWMVSAYRPDPRLPPDQQLLPTVAKRLQQEKWEREGKFGTVYDKEFRPLTDEGFLKPPEPSTVPDTKTEKEAEKEGQKEGQPNWPLKPDPKPTPPGRTNSYSTMPKIADKPATSPLPSPRTPVQQAQPTSTVRLPVPPEDSPQKKGGCGCCIVM